MCEHCNENHKEKKKIIRIAIGVLLVIIAYLSKNISLYIVAYIITGYDVILNAIKNLIGKKFFDENFLMAIATIGALWIGEYPEAVCVMLLYQIGEFLQDKAVDKSKESISELVKIMPEYANIQKENNILKIEPEEVQIGDTVVIQAGEKVPVDGEIIEGSANIDTSSITGESIPQFAQKGDKIISGCISKDGMIKVRAEKLYKDSAVSKIIEMVENSNIKKSHTEKFITKFAKIYTPIVVIMAILLCSVPILFFNGESNIWIERALTFLVISCPCAFVLSVPLTFFAGVGRASKSGILIKGSSYLEQLSKASVIVFDKTGTLTKGNFKVSRINPEKDINEKELLKIAAYAEYYSNHPIANAIKSHYKDYIDSGLIKNYKENAGQGITAEINGHEIMAGNAVFVGIDDTDIMDKSCVFIKRDNNYIGNIVISDEIKDNAKELITKLKNEGIKTVILSGDKENNTQNIAQIIGIDKYYATLLPSQKVEKIEEIINTNSKTTVFVGDGINDAPVLTRSDVGIAMGAIGTDAAIEAADIVIADDNLEKIFTAIKISKKTILIAKQNITLAILVKALFLVLGALGFMTMWFAVFADVGVTLIAVLNSLRTLRK